MNLIDREIEKLRDNLFYLAGVDYSEYDAMNNNTPPNEEAIELIKSFAQRVISETKEKCIKALPKERKLDGSHFDVHNNGFNKAIQQAKENIKGVR